MRFQKCNLYYILFKLLRTRSRIYCWLETQIMERKTHVKKKVWSFSIINHFTDVCSETDDPSRNIRFIIIDLLNNTNSFSPDDIDNLLLQKEKFWISTLVTIDKGPNSTHDWNRKCRTERPKRR